MSKKVVSINETAITVLSAVVALNKRGHIPILQAVNVATDKHGSLVAVASDLDNWVAAPVENLTPGIYDIVGKELVKSAQPVKNFPEWQPRIEAGLQGGLGYATVTKNELVRAISCISKEASRYTLNGAYFAGARKTVGGVNLVSTDGHRLTLNCLLHEGTIPANTGKVVPKTFLALANKFLAKGETVRFDFGEETVGFSIKGARFASRYLSGQFPNYEAVVTKKAKEQWTVWREVLIDALKTLKPYLKNATHTSVSIVRTDKGLDLTAKSSDQSRTVSINATIDKHPVDMTEQQSMSIVMPMRDADKGVTVGLNLDYLLEFANTITGNTVVMAYTDPTTQVTISGNPFPHGEIEAEQESEAA